MRKSLPLRSALAAALALGAAPLPLLAEQLPSIPLTAAPADFSDVVEAVSPAVVSISVEMRGPTAQSGARGGDGGGGLDRFGELPPELREFFDRFGRGGSPFADRDRRAQPESRRGSAQGSGFFVSADGYVVTNNHVIEDGATIKIQLEDGRELPARLVGADPRTDLALLKVEGEDFPFVRFGDSARARVGQWVVTIGNPFGLGGTATAGIVSAVGRDIRAGSYDDFIQIDAPINRGNSGGPAFNLQGEVIGVNTVIFSPSGGNVGIGFAISSNMAREVIEGLKENGRVERGWLGVAIQPLSPVLAEGVGLDAEAKGALVSHVEPDGPAARAGVQVRDVVVSFAGAPIEDARSLSRAVGGQRPGATLPLEVIRGGERKTISIDLGSLPGEEGPQAAVEAPAPGEGGARLGLSLRNDRENGGVVVDRVRPDSAAEEAGIEVGDRILGVGDSEVSTAAQAADAIRAAQAEGRKALLLQIVKPEDERSVFVALPLSGS